MKKRLLSMLLVMVLLVGILPFNVFADGSAIPPGSHENGYVTNILLYEGSTAADGTLIDYTFNQATTENYITLITTDTVNRGRLKLSVSDASGTLWMRRLIDGTREAGVSSAFDQKIASVETMYILNYWLNTAWPKDGQEHVFTIQVGPKYDSDGDGNITRVDEFEKFDVYNFHISSIPGLSALAIKDAEGTELEITPAFLGGVKQKVFETTVTGNAIKLSTTFSDGATLTIGDKSYTAALTDEEIALDKFIGKGPVASIPLKLVDAYGKENTFTLKINIFVPFAERKPVVTAANDKKTGQIKLTITPVEDAVKYKVFVAEKADGEYKLAAETDKTEYTYKGKAGTKYFFKVVAVDKDGAESAESAVVNKVQLPGQVTSLKAKSTKKKEVTLTWKKVTGAKKYFIYMSKNGKTGWKKIGTATKTKFVYKKGTPGKKLYFRVQAVTANGKMGEFSKAVSVKVKK